MPWKPDTAEAHSRMEEVMAPLIPSLRTVMLDRSPVERALRQAMHDVLDGSAPEEAAARHGLSIVAVQEALARLAQQRFVNAAPKRRMAPADRRKLTQEQEMHLHALMRSALPDALGGTELLWSRESARWLVERETGLRMPDRTLSTYLERWGFAPEKPLRTAAARQPARMREWLKRDYPVLAMLAREADGFIGWWGCTPLLARAQGKQLPGRKLSHVDSPLWQKDTFNLLFITTNRGHARWLVHEGPPTMQALLLLLNRAVATDTRKLFLIVPTHPLFAAPEFVAWALRNKDAFSFHFVTTEDPIARYGH